MAATEVRHIVNFITGNKNKLSEVKAILEPAIQVESQALDLIEVQGTLDEVTLDKCRRAADLVRFSFFVSLSRRCPTHSVVVRRFADERCGEQDPRPGAGGRHVLVFQCIEWPAWALHVRFTDHLLSMWRGFSSFPLSFFVAKLPSSKWFMTSIGHAGLNNLLAAYEDKSAKAVCTFAYSAGPGHEPILFQGITDGKIVPARGPPDFGS